MDGQTEKRKNRRKETEKWTEDKYIIANIVAFHNTFLKTSGKGTHLDER
jgi:hypothetical protein